MRKLIIVVVEQEAPTLPDWGKMRFTRYAGKAWAEILPGATAEARELVGGLVVFESGRRLRAEEVCFLSGRFEEKNSRVKCADFDLDQALKHPYFTSEEK